jgi:hypothetical protein
MVNSVSVQRQWNRIDLLVEVDVIRNGAPYLFALNIENKWYSYIRLGQLTSAKAVTEAYYKGKRDVVDLVIFCDDCYKRNPQDIQECKANGYKLLTIGDIAKFMEAGGNPTGNALFDEYWCD